MKKTVLLTAILCVFGTSAGFSQLLSKPKQAENQGFTVEDQRKINNLMGAISALYVDTIDNKKLTETAIVAILKDLDPHSQYIPKKEVERFNEPLEGSFDGIGVSFQMFEDTLLVMQTIAGCPAEKVGVLPGDRIVFVGEENIAGVKKQNSDITKLLRGRRGTEVTVKIKRAGEKDLLIFNIIRNKIPIYSVDAKYMIDREIGYVRINNFGANTLQEYREAMKLLEKQGMKSLILNLQGNGGGYLNAAVELANEFLGRGKLIVYTEGLHQPRRDEMATNKGDFERNKLVVLVDEFSASASEIVSGAIQDWDRGVIVGRRTFGKGLVQRQLPLTDGSMIRLTIARYYTPSGRCIQKPYKGNIDYEKDLLNRYEHGEMYHLDSIHLADSLKYTTLINHRTVYGGGGVMPDVFVPIDTTAQTPYYRKLFNRGVVNRAYLRFMETYRETLKVQYPDFQTYKNYFDVPEELLQMVKDRADELKIEFVEQEYEKSLPLLKTNLKAQIAGDLWTTNEFYQIADQTNDALVRAVEILQKRGEYEKLLKEK